MIFLEFIEYVKTGKGLAKYLLLFNFGHQKKGNIVCLGLDTCVLYSCRPTAPHSQPLTGSLLERVLKKATTSFFIL